MVTSAAPVAEQLAEHIGAYAEVALADLQASTRNMVGRVCAAAIMSLAVGFTLLMGCVWLIGATWTTSAHIPVMIALLLFGSVAAVAAFATLQRYRRSAPSVMARTVAEWAKDRSLVEELVRLKRQADA